MKMNEKGTIGLQRPVSTPPTAATLVAPHIFKKKAPKMRNIASTTISNLSIGGGIKTLVINIIEPKRAVINNRSALFTRSHHFLQRK